MRSVIAGTLGLHCWICIQYSIITMHCDLTGNKVKIITLC